MIDKVLERGYVLSRMDLLAAAPDAPRDDLPDDLSPADPALPDDLRQRLTAEDLGLADAALRDAVGRAAEALPGPVPDLGRGKRGRPLSERAFFPRDPATSIAQVALEAYLMRNRFELLEPTAPVTGRRAAASGDPVATYRMKVDPPAVDSRRRLAGPFEITDPGWVKSVIAMGWRLFRKRRRFEDRPADPVTLDDDARVLIVGDWASGIHRARRVAAEMRRWLANGEQQGRQQHVVHLGDTYYAGFKHEYRENFLPHWPVDPGAPHRSWSLNGNHDMYAGGHGYFDCLLADGRFAAQQQSSWFSIENEHWQLLGLDTAWDDHALKGDQAEWVAARRRDHPGRKTLLMSHHQLFSSFAGDGPKIEQALRDAGALDEPLDAWFWGHEHRGVAYLPDPRVRHARIVGHGGVPVYADSDPNPSGVAWRDDDYFKGGMLGLERWALFGFAALDFRGPEIDVSYVDEWGRVRYKEAIV